MALAAGDYSGSFARHPHVMRHTAITSRGWSRFAYDPAHQRTQNIDHGNAIRSSHGVHIDTAITAIDTGFFGLVTPKLRTQEEAGSPPAAA